MSERSDRPADEASLETPRTQAQKDAEEGGSPGTVGALDGAAAAGGLGGVSAPKPGSVMPQEAPDPSIGPD